ncbi:hypothetical protein SDRG_09035 [Saprolegnia diclina VS20]|uniref:WRKY19-like zinc finger domain-containing protein n=1 Tax=Saprolegnia diclina (strain VS20) TaxID=1156394 RepID=T0RMI8_SAPDV|nr:hypothetical protein SDRG_09035 [Saprolegnia diclina VS20]EQC33528.1 hypothetical protein SDRG_09035 [Saprolegnia diclina VS20]|eukprot:XP_008613168.1 hypothetical protein SDRG_09035 [Saprolegnia diclina VS20]
MWCLHHVFTRCQRRRGGRSVVQLCSSHSRDGAACCIIDGPTPFPLWPPPRHPVHNTMDLHFILTPPTTTTTAVESNAVHNKYTLEGSGNSSPTSPEGLYPSYDQHHQHHQHQHQQEVFSPVFRAPTLPPLCTLHPEHVRPSDKNIQWYRSVMARTNPLESMIQGPMKRPTPVQTAPRGGACIIQGCRNKAVSRGKCITHGGGCRCKFEGCVNGAKMRGLCHLHGGKRQCQQDGCQKDAKLKGLCWAHGGRRPKPTK